MIRAEEALPRGANELPALRVLRLEVPSYSLARFLNVSIRTDTFSCQYRFTLSFELVNRGLESADHGYPANALHNGQIGPTEAGFLIAAPDLPQPDGDAGRLRSG